MLLFTAGIHAVPQTYYDAGGVDGASKWRLFRSITIPLISPSLFFGIMLTVITSFQVFTQVKVLTSGGPGTSSTTLVYWLFEKGVQRLCDGLRLGHRVGAVPDRHHPHHNPVAVAAALGPLRSTTAHLALRSNWGQSERCPCWPVTPPPVPVEYRPGRRRRPAGLVHRVGISTALKPEADAFDNSLGSFAHATQFNNFVTAWDYGPFGRFLVNGLIVATCGALLTLLTSLTSGYAFARLHFRGRKKLFFIYVATLVIPQEVLVVPMFLMMLDGIPWPPVLLEPTGLPMEPANGGRDNIDHPRPDPGVHFAAIIFPRAYHSRYRGTLRRTSSVLVCVLASPAWSASRLPRPRPASQLSV